MHVASGGGGGGGGFGEANLSQFLNLQNKFEIIKHHQKCQGNYLFFY